MAPQITRISIVYGCVVFAFIGFRSLTVPESFGKTGHFRHAALAELASHPMKFEGKQPCIDCHQNNSPHTDKGVSCEACHGPGAAHAKDFDSAKLLVPKTRAFCGTCHAMETARRATFPQIDLTDHYPSQRCIECHDIHPDDGKPIGSIKGEKPDKPQAAANSSSAAKPADGAKTTPASGKTPPVAAKQGGKK